MADKYTFRREFTDMYGNTKTVEHTIEADTVSEILEDFLYFMNGCSFAYIRDLIYVTENGQEHPITEYSVDLDNPQQSFDFEEEPTTVVELQEHIDALVDSVLPPPSDLDDILDPHGC